MRSIRLYVLRYRYLRKKARIEHLRERGMAPGIDLQLGALDLLKRMHALSSRL